MAYQYIYLARHGECTSNVTGDTQGPDDELTKEGRRQACLLGERVKHLPTAHFWTSSLNRSVETAAEITRSTGKEAVVSDLLIEIRNPSEIVGLNHSTEEYQNFQKARRKSFADNRSDFRYSDEETYAEVQSRAEQFLGEVTAVEGDVLCVSHGHFLRFLCAHIILGRSMQPQDWLPISQRLFMGNVGINILRRNVETDHWSLLAWNDQAHFADK